MPAVTCHTLLLHHRRMLVFDRGRGRFNIGVTVETNLTGTPPEQLVLVSAMGHVAGVTLALGKWSVRRPVALLGNQVLMTGQAQLALIGRDFQQPGNISTVRGVTARTLATGERPMLSVEPFFRLSLAVAGEAKVRFLFVQKPALSGFVGSMALEAEPLLGGNMRIFRLRINLFTVAFETEGRSFTLEQRISLRRMSVMT